MKQKLIFLDIDGTLLPPGEMLIPQSTVEALHKAHANGHKLFLCTGRNLRMTQPLLDYGFDGAVCSAGGYVFCGDKVLVDLPMEPQLAQGVRSAMERHGVECTLEARDATYGSLKMIERWSFTHRDAGPLNSEAARWRKAMEDGMSITPVEQATTEKQSGAVVEYHFSGNNTEANGITFNSYTWDGNAWQNMDKPIGVYGMGLNNGTGKIIFRHDADTINVAYDIEMTFPRGGASTQYGDSSELSKLPTDNLTVAVTGQEKPIDDLAVDVEIPLVVRVFNTDGATHTVDINAFIEPDSSEELKNCIYADAITATFVYDDSIPK